jgi:Leucine-rich repeat (LRR) protein
MISRLLPAALLISACSRDTPAAPAPQQDNGAEAPTDWPSLGPDDSLYSGGSPDAPVVEFCRMKVPEDVHILWCQRPDQQEMPRLARFERLKLLMLMAHARSTTVRDGKPGLPLDISALFGVPTLQELHVYGYRPSGLQALQSAIGLRELFIQHVTTADLPALGRLVSLEKLHISKASLTDVDALGGLVNLTNLSISSPDLADIAALSRLHRLTDLDLGFTAVHDLTPLADLHLQALNLNSTAVHDLTPLARLALRSLDLSDTAVADLSPLHTKFLEDLYIGSTKIRKLDALSKGSHLLRLSLNGNRIDSLTPLLGHHALKSLSASKGGVDPAQLALLQRENPNMHVYVYEWPPLPP